MAELTTIPSPSRRALLTGIGVVAPNGIGIEAWWEATKSGTSGIGPITHFDPSKYETQLAGEVEDFDPDDYIEKRLEVQTDRWTHMALAATQMALDDAEYDPSEQDEWSHERDHRARLGRERVRPEGDPGAVGPGPRLRRRLPVDRLVLRRHDRADLDPARPEGAVRRRRRPRAPGGLEALQHSRRTIRRGFETS